MKHNKNKSHIEYPIPEGVCECEYRKQDVPYDVYDCMAPDGDPRYVCRVKRELGICIKGFPDNRKSTKGGEHQ